MEKMPFPRLTEDQCRRIHEASLEILDRVGVRLDLPEAVDLLKKAGAKVDQENLVHLSSQPVENALASVSTCRFREIRKSQPYGKINDLC